jgi:tRNA(Arg) A34 adenosine deaminase TadA
MADDQGLLRETFAIARRALLRGNRPFGALLVAANGAVLGAAENSQLTGEQVLAHAEMNLLHRAVRETTPDVLATATIYTNAEPCAMCAGAIFWSGVGRLVYGLSGDRLHELSGFDPHVLISNARTVLGSAGRRVEVVGPLLEAEAAKLFTEDVV